MAKAAVAKAIQSIDVLEERSNFLDKLSQERIVSLYYQYLVKCDEENAVFDHYLQFFLHHFWYFLFEQKILLNGRLHDQYEEIRYTDYVLPNVKGSFHLQEFSGSESETKCSLSELSCDGLRYGAIREVITIVTQ